MRFTLINILQQVNYTPVKKNKFEQKEMTGLVTHFVNAPKQSLLEGQTLSLQNI